MYWPTVRCRPTKFAVSFLLPSAAHSRACRHMNYMVPADHRNRAAQLLHSISQLERHMLTFEAQHAADIARAAPDFRPSVRNLLHYLALRQLDLRQVQTELAALGLSSLGRMESYALDGVRNVQRALGLLAGEAPAEMVSLEPPPVDFFSGRALLQRHTAQLLGEAHGSRNVRIMVTMPSTAASDPELVHKLLDAGMDVMRINCAHDDYTAWQSMIDNLHAAERASSRRCLIYADLAGPKLRTRMLDDSHGASVRRFKPRRDVRGRVLAPTSISFTDSDVPGDNIPVHKDLLTHARKGDELHVTDARGKRRVLTVTTRSPTSLTTVCDQTIYLETGALISLQRSRREIATATVGELPFIEEPLLLHLGDTLVLAHTDASPASQTIGCTLPEVFSCAKSGERIFFDDGRIGGRITRNDGEHITIRITQCSLDGSKLGSEKGINLPDTELHTPALTVKDLTDLAFIAQRVDIVGMSFVHSPSDVMELRRQLVELGATDVGTVLKIENRRAFENLPRLLLDGLAHPPIGVMVARGDLAVELGFERLAEVQEQILWLCEAAHVPVIWATQVLDTMARSGVPSRAEVTDAVMSGRAECVMLNKGPYMTEVVALLSNILSRMSAHQSKKRALLRPLSVSKLE